MNTVDPFVVGGNFLSARWLRDVYGAAIISVDRNRLPALVKMATTLSMTSQGRRHVTSVCVCVRVLQMRHALPRLLATRRSSTTASPRSSAWRPETHRRTSTSAGRAAGASPPDTDTTATRSCRSRTAPCCGSTRSVPAATTDSSSVWLRTALATRPPPPPPYRSTPRDSVCSRFVYCVVYL